MTSGQEKLLTGSNCFWCDARPIESKLQIDHVVPRFLGGPDEPWNLVNACNFCNGSKSSDWPADFVMTRLHKNLVKMRRAMRAAEEKSWFWTDRGDWSGFVDSRLKFAFSVEGRFMQWASDNGHPDALRALEARVNERQRCVKDRRRPWWYDPDDPDSKLVDEIILLEQHVQLLQNEVRYLCKELAAANAELMHPWMTQSDWEWRT